MHWRPRKDIIITSGANRWNRTNANRRSALRFRAVSCASRCETSLTSIKFVESQVHVHDVMLFPYLLLSMVIFCVLFALFSPHRNF